ncbi:hypothetical protein [Coleofasciculus chthonoplastes]
MELSEAKTTARKSAAIYWKNTEIEGTKTRGFYGRTSVRPYGFWA